MKSLAVLLLIFMASAANAIPHEDCTAQFQNQFHADYVEKISLDDALEITFSEGFLEGRALRAAQLKLVDAKQIYAVYSSDQGGSATDLVTADRSCYINDVIRVQEE